MASDMQLNNAISTPSNLIDILSVLAEQGIIQDKDSAIEAMRKSERIKILNKHNHPITQGKDRRWRTRVDDSTRPEKRRMIVKSTKEAVEDALIVHYKSLDATLASLRPDWRKERDAEHSTIEREDRIWKQYLEDSELVNIPIKQLNSKVFKKHLKLLHEQYDFNRHQYGNVKTLLNSELNYAVDQGLIDRNPALGVTSKDLKLKIEVKKTDGSQVYSVDEVDKFFKLAEDDLIHEVQKVHKLAPLAAEFVFLSGLRRGEICALRYSDLEGHSVKLQRRVRKEKKELVNRTKGKDGQRNVYIPDEGMRIIERAKAMQIENGAPSDGYIFSMTNGPLSYYAIYEVFHKYCKKMGIDVKSPHKARKTYVSALHEGGVAIDTIRDLAGHVDTRTTYNNYIYDRSSEDAKNKAIEKAIKGLRKSTCNQV